MEALDKRPVDYWANYSNEGTAMTQRECYHWQDKIAVGKFTVAVSGLLGNGKRKYVDPDLGIYLAKDWVNYLNEDLATPGLAIKGLDAKGPQFYIANWKDFGVIDLDKYRRLVDLAVEWVEAGKTVELGCMGGHGRTGTLLAGLFVKLEGLGAEDAIEAVRRMHCGSAIENDAQERLVYEFTGEPFPVLAKVKAGTDWLSPVDDDDLGEVWVDGDYGLGAVDMSANDDELDEGTEKWIAELLAETGQL